MRTGWPLPGAMTPRTSLAIPADASAAKGRFGSRGLGSTDGVVRGRLAVVTGGGTGMGRELVIQLAADGCSVATCDVNVDHMEETARRAEKDAPADVRITTHLADVSDEAQMNRFRDEVVAQHETDH